ncbi:DNA-binding NarL/FixJ family response regulator [Peribacillus deserti]|uniref:DNA-binding NarL/FixJ family response regulator n=1 Tax=Peribacillus deserti TaxID=673318 RepID=A0ABS2QFM7_9BACI|nr:response regulator transcription factor [Peribacillus deserti]MBM7691966.1 DNA-binding NarL/FixJ family response regulator [Peribacillus deserti]
MSIRVLIADDHHVVRRGLALFLQTQEGIEVAGEAKDGAEAAAMSLELKPDIILMDLDMPAVNGIEATKLIKQNQPESCILILTSFSDQDHVLPALEAGASGYQLKDIEPDELVLVIKKVLAGENQIHPKATSLLISALSGSSSNKKPMLHELTKREREVLLEIASGKSNKEISSALFITEKTVKTHVSNILSKLGLADRTQAALYAVRNGWTKA